MHVVKGALVGEGWRGEGWRGEGWRGGGWFIIKDPQTKQYLDWGVHTTNIPVVDGASGYGFHRLPGPSRE